MIDIYFPENNYIILLIIIGIFLVFNIENNPKTRFRYSKFSNNNINYKISTKKGMFLIYFPSLVFFLFLILDNYLISEFKVRIFYILNILHYFKRIIEVLYLHKYSSVIDIQTIISISFMYFSASFLSNFFVNMVPNNIFNISYLYIGITFFIIGECINGYHHYILASLRNDDMKYRIPTKGLFKYVYCPHYLGEIISQLGCSLLSQNFIYIIYVCLMITYLTTRANNTLKWYESKFGKRKNIKRIIPYIY